jgi:hypothetical protein
MMAIFIKITPVTTGRPHLIATRTIARVEPINDPAFPEAQSLIVFANDARSLVTEDIDTIAAAARG